MHNSIPLSFRISEKLAGKRLDVALGSVFPDTGVRARRRLWSWCNICVNGKAQPSGYAVKVGDIISVQEIEESFSSSSSLPCFFSAERQKISTHDTLEQSKALSPNVEGIKNVPSLLVDFEDFILFYKPSGMHTSIISGKKTLSLESILPELLQNQYGKSTSSTVLPILLTRLDFLTSGIVIAAKNEEAKRRFRQWEYHGNVEKKYFAVADGNISEHLVVKNALDVSKRVKTRVLEEEGDFTRWSRVTPIMGISNKERLHLPYMYKKDTLFEREKSFEGESSHDIVATLVSIVILCGARHQIRAHLAHVGYPLVGDPLYGQKGNSFLLHHGAVTTPEFSYEILPDWFNKKE